MEPKHTVHKPVRVQLHGGLQPQGKNAVRLGPKASSHLLSDLELNQGATVKTSSSRVAGSLFQCNLQNIHTYKKRPYHGDCIAYVQVNF